MRWRILNKPESLSAPKQEKIKTEEIIKVLLKNRGLKNRNQQEEFLNPKPPEKLRAEEVGISSSQIERAIERIKEAVKNKEKIIIYGDYDADGICATAILWEAIYKLGGEVLPFIPQRKEGYGMKVERLEEMAKTGVKLVVTVDQGIVAFKQAVKAKKLGLDLIITDHHVSEERKPLAEAIVYTPKLSGAGVAWFLAKEMGSIDGVDLATIGTVADVVPLIGPSRSLVKYGISAVRNTKRPGLLSLYQKAGVSPEIIDTYELGYIIGPRLNATGRIDDPMDSLRLICTKDKNKAEELAEKIEERNKQRQILTEQITTHARHLWLKTDGKSALIFVQDKSYEDGVIGLVAGKLMEEFGRPAVVLAPRQNYWIASARSIREFNIIEAVRHCAEFLDSHGGHPKAAGFTIEESKISLVRQKLIELAESQLDKEKLKPTLVIDMELPLEALSLSLYEKIEKLAPFGEGNPLPVFVSRGLQVVDARTIGLENHHLKLWLASKFSGFTLEAVGFGIGNFFPRLSPEKPVDVAYNLLLDEWNGKRKLQLKIKDIRVK